MRVTGKTVLWLRWSLLITVIVLPGVSIAQGSPTDNPEELVNYAYAVGDTSFLNVVGQSVQVARIPISYRLRSIDEHGWGMRLTFPVSLGFHEFKASTALGGELRENLGTVSLVPGVEFEVPLSLQWTLRSFVEAGAGKDLEGGEWAYIYSGGLKALWVRPHHSYEFRVGGGLEFNGSTLADRSLSNGYTTAELGLDTRRRLKSRFAGRATDFSVYAVRRRFVKALQFERLDGGTTELRNQNEIGVTFGVGRPFKLWLIQIDRIGLGYRWGGSLDSVRILFEVPF